MSANLSPCISTRKLDEITPEEYSRSYKRLVQRNFAENEETIEYTIRNRTKETDVRYEGLMDLLTRVNTTRDAIDEDGDSVLPVNFNAIGCILLDFVNGLSEHMVSLHRSDACTASPSLV